MAATTPKEQQQTGIAVPMRKALSLSTFFRTERAVRSRPSSDVMDDTKPPYYNAAVKRIRRMSLRRSPTISDPNPTRISSIPSSSSSSSSSTSQDGSPKSAYSAQSRVFSHHLFPETSEQDEEEDFTPPQRPACPAPLLNLSLEVLSLQNDDKWYASHISHVTRLRADILGKLSVMCPSEESFYCRGLQDDPLPAQKVPWNRNRRPTMTPILAPSALKLRPKASLLTIDNSDTASSPTSSIYSFETTPEAAAAAPFDAFHTPSSSSFGLKCPASPPPTMRLQLILPPTASLTRHLTLIVDSNASTLELKESLCSTLLQQFRYKISPSSIALSFTYKFDEPARILENSRPLYQEGLQDDDDILVRF